MTAVWSGSDRRWTVRNPFATALSRSERRGCGGWRVFFDETDGSPFWHHKETGETMWELPAQVAAIAPPPTAASGLDGEPAPEAGGKGPRAMRRAAVSAV